MAKKTKSSQLSFAEIGRRGKPKTARVVRKKRQVKETHVKEESHMGANSSVEYGELLAYMHIGGYSLHRGFDKLTWLLEDGRWKKAGDGFTDVLKFMESLNVKEILPLIEQKKKIAEQLKALQPEASNRKIAKAVGVSNQTIMRNTAPDGAASQKKSSDNKGSESVAAPHGAPLAPAPSAPLPPMPLSGSQSAPPPRVISGAAAANLVHRREVGAAERKERITEDEQRILNLQPVAGKFRTIVMDPAWEYDWLSIAGRAKPGYAMQTHEQLLALDVRAWADEETGCQLYVWVTNNFMARACELVKHWGFQHRILMTWIKPPPFGLGSYFRNSTEHVLYATLGATTTRPAAAGIPTHFEAPRGEHSEKPERFYEIVRASSYPPYGEANQRKPRPDFTNLFCEVTEHVEEAPPVEVMPPEAAE